MNPVVNILQEQWVVLNKTLTIINHFKIYEYGKEYQ